MGGRIVNGITNAELTWQPYGNILGRLGLKRPVFNVSSIEIVSDPYLSTFAQVAKHEAMHASDYINHPWFSYIANMWKGPGLGTASFIMETRGYYAEFGFRGLRPSYAWGSLLTIERIYFTGETIVGAAGLGYAGYRLIRSDQ